MTESAVIFGLAGAAYLLLAKDTALRLAGREWPIIGWLAAATALAHVVALWVLRYEGSVERAWTRSPPAFVIFHSALLLILLAPVLSGRRRRAVTILAFAIVSLGVLPAPLRYPEVAVLGIPVWLGFGAVLTVAATRRAARN